MSKLKANVEDLQNAEKKLKTADSDLDQLRKELQEILGIVNAEWKGEAAEAYKNKINGYIKDVNSIQASVKDLESYSHSVGERMSFIDKIVDLLTRIFSFGLIK